MNKADMINIVREQTGSTKTAAASAIDALFDTMSKSLKKEGALSIAGFGGFKVTKRAARTGRNPQTGEKIKIKASKSVRFRPAKALKDSLGKR
ncbi:MAG: HU family DNA-binding protein [Sneathiellaceae bacterium]